jgi:Tol biopolymer transport system component
MATGRHAYTGKSQASLIAAILSSEPPSISALQPATPSSLDRVVKTCMAKDPEDRWQTVHDVMLQLKWISENPSEHSVPSVKRPGRFLERAIWAIAVLIFACLFLFFYTRRAGNASVIRFMVPPPAGSSFDNTIALSPNGKLLVFVANDSEGNNILWLRKIDSSHPVNLRDTEGASFPFWSPDSQSIGFFAQGKLKHFDLAANKTQTICAANNPKGGTWNREGIILFAQNEGGAIYHVSSKGGNPQLETSFDQSRGEATIRYPFFLPDDRHYLCYVFTTDPKKAGIYVGTLNSKQRVFVTPADSGAVYTPGYLIYLSSGGHLMAHAFDLKNFKKSGDPTPLDEKVWVKWFSSGFTAITASQNGVVAYRTGGYETSEFIWYDRTGKQLGKAGPPGLYAEPALSPDEKKIVFPGIGDAENKGTDLWILEFTRGITSRFTSKKSRDDVTPVWSPDGTSIVYASYPEGAFYDKNLLNGKEVPVLKLTGFATTEDWSQDGQFIIYTPLDLKTNQSDIWILPTKPGGKPFPFVTTEYNEQSLQTSPDGQWIAYVSDESGRFEVYVQTFPTPGQKVQISTSGGDQPKWRGDSKEIFYIAPDNKVMSVDFHAGASEQPLAKVLFQSRIMSRVEARNHYVVTSDGQRFLINTPSEEIAKSPIEVVLNWTTLLQ